MAGIKIIGEYLNNFRFADDKQIYRWTIWYDFAITQKRPKRQSENKYEENKDDV